MLRGSSTVLGLSACPELFVELALRRLELPRDVEDHRELKVAAAIPVVTRQALAGYAQHTAGLGSWRHPDPRLPPG